MNYDKIHDHVVHTTSHDSNQIPNLEPKEMSIIIDNLMETIKSLDKLDRLSIRRTCWDTFKDSNSRQVIDLCFPAQLGPLCVWPPPRKIQSASKTDIGTALGPVKHVRVDPPSEEIKSQSPVKDQTRSRIRETEKLHYSNNEIMAKLDLMSDKIDNMSNLLLKLFTYTNNGNKHIDS
jgi:hypothetical protein